MNLEEHLLGLHRRISKLQTTNPIMDKRQVPFLDALAIGEERIAGPTMATWNVTRSCNLRCTYCAVEAPFRRPEPEDLATPRLLEAVRNLELTYISLLGGEPTLNRHLPTYIESLSAAGTFVDLTTNGAHLTAELFSALKTARSQNLLSLMLSLDSADKTTNDSLRGRGSYNTCIRAAKSLSDHGIPFSIGMTIGRKNIHSLLETYELAQAIGANQFCSWFIMPAGRAQPRMCAIPDLEFYEQANRVLDRVESGEGIPVGRMDLSYATPRLLRDHDALRYGHSLKDSEELSKINCEGCRYRVLIDVNGDVYPCDFLQHPMFRMGNIVNNTWEDIWNSSPALFKAKLSRLNKPGCRDCCALGCDTGCFGVTFAEFLRSGRILPMCEV